MKGIRRKGGAISGTSLTYYDDKDSALCAEENSVPQINGGPSKEKRTTSTKGEAGGGKEGMSVRGR